MGKNKILDIVDKEKMRSVMNVNFRSGVLKIFILLRADSLRRIIDNLLRWHYFIYFIACFLAYTRDAFFSKVSYKNFSYTRPKLFFCFCMVLGLLFSSCALPRIIVLDDPLSPEEHLNLGVAYEKKGALDSALKEYKMASKKLPVAYTYIGNVYFQKNEYDDAETYYKKAIKKIPKNADAYNNLAWLYYIKKENLAEAEELAAKAIELDPSRESIYKDTLDKIRGLITQQKSSEAK